MPYDPVNDFRSVLGQFGNQWNLPQPPVAPAAPVPPAATPATPAPAAAPTNPMGQFGGMGGFPFMFGLPFMGGMGGMGGIGSMLQQLRPELFAKLQGKFGGTGNQLFGNQFPFNMMGGQGGQSTVQTDWFNPATGQTQVLPGSSPVNTAPAQPGNMFGAVGPRPGMPTMGMPTMGFGGFPGWRGR